jgi:DNA-binding NarL/FixJ family response regulator
LPNYSFDPNGIPHFAGRSNSLKKTVVICDTQPIAMEGLRALLGQLQDMTAVGEATSIMAGMDLVRTLSPAMLVIDKSFGLQPVMDWITSLRGNGRHTSVMVWGHSVNEAEALRMVQAGAQGVIRKTAPLVSLSDCLRAVAAGNTWMDDLMFQNAEKTNGSGRSNLTMREQQVAELVEQGLKNKEIARSLGICPGTVKIHLKHIFEKTGVRGRYGLALSGLKERGYLPAARYN